MPTFYCPQCAHAIRFSTVKPADCPACHESLKPKTVAAKPVALPSRPSLKARAVEEDYQDDPVNDEVAVGEEESDHYDKRAGAALKRQLIASLQRSGGIRFDSGDDDGPVKLGDWVGRPKQSS
jgi:hypothetical protein